MTSGMSWYLGGEGGWKEVKCVYIQVEQDLQDISVIHYQGKYGKSFFYLFKAHFKEKDSLVIFPETVSKKASFRQQRVGGPTSYLMPTTFTDSWS